MKQELSELFVKNLKAPADKRLEVTDTKIPGLTLRVTPAGKKTFSFAYRMPGNKTKQRVQIGTYPAVSIKDARDKAIEIMADIRKNIDPSNQIRKLKKEPLVKDLVQEFYDRELASKKSGAEMYRLLSRELVPELGNRKVSSITRRDVVKLLDKIRDRGSPITANRLHGRLSRMFNFACERGILDASPIVRLRKTPEQPRERVLNDDEIKNFWTRITTVGLHPLTSIALRLILTTAQRPGEVSNMCWNEIDLDARLWTIPAEKSKNGRAHTVPLNSMSVELLSEANKYTVKGTYVFSSPAQIQSKKPIEVRTLSKSISRKYYLLGIQKFVPHDLRRTARTKFAELSINDVVAERILNHSLQGIARVYNHHNYIDEMKTALQHWDNYLRRMIGENIIDLKSYMHTIA